MPSFEAKSVRLLVLALLAVVCIGCDQATKKIATDRLSNSPPISMFGDTLRLQYAENPGGFLGLGGRLSADARFVFLVVFNGAVLAGVSCALLAPTRMSRTNFVALALILTGGIGNMIDRLNNNGLVTDFLNVGIGPVRTGIFNVADIAISAGAIALTLAMFAKREPQPATSN